MAKLGNGFGFESKLLDDVRCRVIVVPALATAPTRDCDDGGCGDGGLSVSPIPHPPPAATCEDDAGPCDCGGGGSGW